MKVPQFTKTANFLTTKQQFTPMEIMYITEHAHNVSCKGLHEGHLQINEVGNEGHAQIDDVGGLHEEHVPRNGKSSLAA